MAEEFINNLSDHIHVMRLSVDLEAATVDVALDCGHSLKVSLSGFPLIRITGTLGFPEVGEAVVCPTCEDRRTIPIVYGTISDEFTPPDQSLRS